MDFFRKTNLNFRPIMFAILIVTLRKKYENQGQCFRKFKRILPTVQVHISPFYIILYFFSNSLLPFFTGIWARRIWAIWAKPFRHCLIKCKNTFTITTWDEWVKEIAIQVRQVRKEFCMYKILSSLCLGSVSVRSTVIHLQPYIYTGLESW